MYVCVNKVVMTCFCWLQGGGNDCPEIRKCEKARLREMQKSKKQKIQEILDAEDASVEANRVSLVMITLLTYFFNLRLANKFPRH